MTTAGLRRVPGVRRYRALADGVRGLGTSSVAVEATLAGAERIAARARSTGEGEYQAYPTSVRAGWANEERAGARVVETRRVLSDARRRVLVTALRGSTTGGGA